MANFSVSFIEGQDTHRPPFFDGNNYGLWKPRMKVFLESLDFNVWRTIELGYTYPSKPIEEYSDDECRRAQIDNKAIYAISCALSSHIFEKVMYCKNAHDMWNLLDVLYRNTNEISIENDKKEEDVALMAIDNKRDSKDEDGENEISSSSSSSCDELSYNELFDAFHKLHGEFRKLASKYSKFKKSHLSMLNEKEKEIENHSSMLHEKEKEIENHSSMLHEKDKEIDELRKENKSLIDRLSSHQNLINENAILKDRVEMLKKDDKENSRMVHDVKGKIENKTKHASKRIRTRPKKRNNRRKHDGHIFSQSCKQISSPIVCYSCHKKGHKMNACPYRNDPCDKNNVFIKNYGYKRSRKKWVIKGSYIEVDNPHPFGPKRIWVPLHPI